MIDTIKLAVGFTSRPEWYRKARLQYSFDTGNGLVKAIANPSTTNKKKGIYQPRLTYLERPRRDGGKTYELAVELSLPKLLYGNNFSELSDSDFSVILNKLSNVLRETYGILLTPQELEGASVRKIDYSKNIIFSDHTPVSSLVSNMRMADISKVYDVQNTDFKNGGHVYHIHTNSMDIAMYDKIADLKQERKSPKRSREKDGYVQMKIIDTFDKNSAITVARFEVRINGLKKIRRELANAGITCDTTFREMFSSNNSRKIMLKHWNHIFERIPKGLLDSDEAEDLLINITKANQGIKLKEAFALVGEIYLLKNSDERYIRNLAEDLFTPSQYRRFRQKGREPPNPTQLKTLLHVTNTLTAMKPVSIDEHIL